MMHKIDNVHWLDLYGPADEHRFHCRCQACRDRSFAPWVCALIMLGLAFVAWALVAVFVIALW